VPPIAELLPAAVLFVAVVLEVLVSPAVALVSVVLPEIEVELVPAAPVPVVVVVAETLKKASDGCSHAVVLMSGNWLRVKLGACASRFWSTFKVNTIGAGATAVVVVALSLARTNVHGTGTNRPAVVATMAASAQPTGLMTTFSIRPTG
jgi:hypothetical protein